MGMLSQDDFSLAEKQSKQAHLFLSKHNLAPNPINYSVCYLFVSKKEKQLNLELNKQLNSHKTVDSIFIEGLFEKYLSNSQNLENNFLEPFLSSLSETVDKLNHQVISGRKMSSSLEKVDLALASSDHHQSLREVVSYLIGTIKNSRIQQESLSQELEKTGEEVHQLKSKLEESHQEAILDVLTGLLNRRGCEEELKKLELEDTHSSLLIDIDHFKKFNDQFGHFIGDKVLIKVANVIKKSVNKEDLTIRFGGEEFLVILVNKAISEASLIAEKIRQAINNLKLVQRQMSITLPTISVSIGIAQVEDDPSWDELFKRADEALYQAKHTGRNRCVVG